MKLTDGEKIIIELLADIHKKLGIDDSKANFIMESIYTGNLWSIKQNLDGLLGINEKSREVVDETYNILDMWRFIESSFGSLSKSEKERVRNATDSTEDPEFKGFDGNNDDHFGVAIHMIQQMGLYQEFVNRDLNSHRRVLDGYRRKLRIFKNFGPGELTSDMLIQILKAKEYS